MTRTLSAGAITAITNATGEERVFLIELDYSGGPLRFTTGSRNITHFGVTWTAVGGALGVGAVEESDDLKGIGVELVLDGVDQAIVAVLLAQDYRGRDANIWQAILDPVTGLVEDAIQLFDGLQLDSYEVVENVERDKPMTVRISTTIQQRLSVNEFRGIRANIASHQKLFDGDTFFQHVPSLAGKSIPWGVTGDQIKTPGGGTGGNDPDNEDGDTLP